MFWRFIKIKDDRDEFGRTFEEAWKEHALWCLDVVRKNEPDDQEKMDYIFRNSPSYVQCPSEIRKHLSGDAVFNAYGEIKINFESFKKYYTQDDIDWIKSWWKDAKE